MDDSKFLCLYESKIADGSLKVDKQQECVVKSLSNIEKIIKNKSQKSGYNFSIFSQFLTKEESPYGLYIYGSVGRGKTMLVNMFFEHIDVSSKKRVHYHTFMQELHESIHLLRQKKETHNQDIIFQVIKDYVKDINLLCFDEFFVSNIADALILENAFKSLFQLGVIIIITSNCAPDYIYENGLNRHYIYNFIELIKSKMSIILLGGDCDWRSRQITKQKKFFISTEISEKQEFYEKWFFLANGKRQKQKTLKVHSRDIVLKSTVEKSLLIPYSELLENFYAAEEYTVIAKNFETVFIENFQAINKDNRDLINRMIVMIDIFYASEIRLYVLAGFEFKDIFPRYINVEGWERMYSRLSLMILNKT